MFVGTVRRSETHDVSRSTQGIPAAFAPALRGRLEQQKTQAVQRHAANSGWVLSEARDITNNFQITGYGTVNGQEHAYRLTRSGAPAPSSLLVAGLGSLLGVVRLRRRRKE